MIPVMQTITSGPRSNCMQAAIASIFELEIDQVPNFAEFYENDDWAQKYHDFCLTQGVYPLTVAPITQEGNPPALFGYHLIRVETTRGRQHAVVGFNGSVVHDPYPGGSEIVKVTNYDVFVSLMHDAGKDGDA